MQAEIPEKLIRDFKVVLQDAEELIKATAGDIEDKTREARAKLAGAMVVAKETCHKLEETVVAGAQATNNIVRGHPYESIGIAFGVGLLAGVLLKRR
jgi:ElaB/YqjD/DUF883 family membrane-anchored ribosome-binding protein